MGDCVNCPVCDHIWIQKAASIVPIPNSTCVAHVYTTWAACTWRSVVFIEWVGLCVFIELGGVCVYIGRSQWGELGWYDKCTHAHSPSVVSRFSSWMCAIPIVAGASTT